jgi:hypothetical protein
LLADGVLLLFHTVQSNGVIPFAVRRNVRHFISVGMLLFLLTGVGVVWLGVEYETYRIRKISTIVSLWRVLNLNDYTRPSEDADQKNLTVPLKANHQSTLLLLLTIETFPLQEHQDRGFCGQHCSSCGAVSLPKCIFTCFFKHCISCSKSKPVHDAAASLGLASLAIGGIWIPS